VPGPGPAEKVEMVTVALVYLLVVSVLGWALVVLYNSA
jgi:hypothetical protein